MTTTPPVVTVTDELLEELEQLAQRNHDYVPVSPASMRALLEHIRTLNISVDNCDLLRKDAESAYLRGLTDQKENFEKAYSSTDCWAICENKTSDGLRAMDAAIDAAMNAFHSS